MDRYIGLDAHSSSCTAVVVGPSGRRLQSQVLETNARVLIGFLKTIPKPRHLCLEEGTHAGWLYEVLAPHVQEIVVAGVGGQPSRGPKSDRGDAFALAEGLRIGAIKTRVYKGLGEFSLLRELSRAYSMIVSDSVRVQNRIKSVYRSRGIPTVGKEVYAPKAREKWLKKLPAHVRALAGLLYQELDAVRVLQKGTEKEMLSEARAHSVYRKLKTCPGMGPIRVAQMLPIVVTPYRFSNKRRSARHRAAAAIAATSLGVLALHRYHRPILDPRL